MEGQKRDYGWWPVGIVRLDRMYMDMNKLPTDVLYITCIYQALDVDVVAWAMKVTNELDVDVIADYT